MSGVFFEELGIRSPDVHLDVGSASHGVQTGKIMVAFDEYLAGRAAPAAVIVVGDVNSTMACALVARKRGIPVVHLEAGLRSFDRAMPEEVNRIVTDAISDLLLVTEPAGLENLANEGISAERIRYVGNVMIDTLVKQLPAARALDVCARWQLRRGDYAVVTLHRPSNVDDAQRLGEVVGFLERIASQIAVIFPVHPRTKARLSATGLAKRLAETPGLRTCDPLGYREFLGLVDASRVVLTDSGGIQEETSFLGIPCITLRTSTERPVTVTCGTNVLVGDDLDAAWRCFHEILDGGTKRATPIRGWDGRAAERVVDALRACQPDLH